MVVWSTVSAPERKAFVEGFAYRHHRRLHITFQCVRSFVTYSVLRHKWFTDVSTTSGEMRRDGIILHEADITPEEIEANLIIGPPELCVEKLAAYAELGIDNVQINMNLGASHADTMWSLEALEARGIKACRLVKDHGA